MAAWIDSLTASRTQMLPSLIIWRCFVRQVNSVSLVSGFFFFFFSLIFQRASLWCDVTSLSITRHKVFCSLFTLTMRDDCFAASKETTVSSLADLGRASFGRRYTDLCVYSVSVHWVCDCIAVLWCEGCLRVRNSNLKPGIDVAGRGVTIFILNLFRWTQESLYEIA